MPIPDMPTVKRHVQVKSQMPGGGETFAAVIDAYTLEDMLNGNLLYLIQKPNQPPVAIETPHEREIAQRIFDNMLVHNTITCHLIGAMLTQRFACPWAMPDIVETPVAEG